MSYKVAVVGATGNVGREILSILAERNFPVSEVVPLAGVLLLHATLPFQLWLSGMEDAQEFIVLVVIEIGLELPAAFTAETLKL